MKVGLVLSGGGAKGAFEAGVVKGILRKVDEFVFSYGCSTGSLISTCVASEKFDFMTRVYTRVKTGNILSCYFWKDVPILNALPSPDLPLEVLLAIAAPLKLPALYNIEPLIELVDSNIDFTALRNAPCEVGYLTSEFDSVKSAFFKSSTAAKTLRDALFASVSMPVFMPLVNISGKSGRYTDGGLTRHLPGKEVFQAKRYAEADAIIFVSTLPANKGSGPIDKVDEVMGILAHTISGLSDSNDYNSLRYEIAEVGQQVIADGKKFIVVQPDNGLPISNSLRFVPEEMKACYDMGIQKAKAVNKLLQ